MSELRVAASSSEVRNVLEDLTTYPHWNDLVKSVEPDGTTAWLATIEARVGPFARSKRLRMVREETTDPDILGFVRDEPQRESFAQWRMRAVVQEVEGDGEAEEHSLVQLELHYDGDLWTSPLEGILSSAIDRAVQRLPEYVQTNRANS